MKFMQYITRDVHGSALQYTSSGKSVQVDNDIDAQIFNSIDEAKSALKLADEKSGTVEDFGLAEVVL